jgi:hypothetical protein
MVVDQIDIGGFIFREPKDDPPIGSNSDAPKAIKLAPERVKSEARKINVLGPPRLVESGQNARNLGDMLRVQFAAIIILVEAPQSTMPKTSDHQARA